jgi:hypothetical protein
MQTTRAILGEKRKNPNNKKKHHLSHNEPFNGPLTEEELDEALSECKGSSTGPDNIHYEFLKKNYRMYTKHMAAEKIDPPPTF